MRDPSASVVDVDSMLQALWSARRGQIVVDIATLVASVEEILDAPAPDADALTVAAGRAHDLTGIFGALQQPAPMHVFRAACDDLRAATQRDVDVDLDATLRALTRTWDGLAR